MRDLDAGDRLRDASTPAAELVAHLDAFAELPISRRWPWFADVEPLTRHPDPAVRAAALRVWHGAMGRQVIARYVESLDATEAPVRQAARDGFARVVQRWPLRLIHGLYHGDPEVRVYALKQRPPRLLQSVWLPLLSDAETAEAARATLAEDGLEPASIPALVSLEASGGVETDWVLDRLADFDWSREWSRTVSAFGGPRVAASLDDADIAERLAEVADPLDGLVRLLVGGAFRGHAGAVRVLEELLASARKHPITQEHRLAMSLLAVGHQLGDLPPQGDAIIALQRWSHLVGDELPVERRRAAARALCGLENRDRATVPKTVLDADVIHVDGVPDVAVLAGLVSLVGHGALKAGLELVTTSALEAAMLAQPDATAWLIRGPAGTRADQSLRRSLMLGLTVNQGPATLDVWNAVIRRLQRDRMAMLGIVAEHVPDLLVDIARGLDGDPALARRHGAIVAMLAQLGRWTLLEQLVDGGLDSLAVREIVAAILSAAGERALKQWAFTVAPELARTLVADDVAEPFLPWAVQQSLIELWRHREAWILEGWGEPPDPSAAPVALPTPKDRRKLETKERQRIAHCPESDLVAAIQPALDGPVTGLAEALASRVGDKPIPVVAAALLLCADSDDDVDAQLARWGGSGPRFLHDVDALVTERFAHSEPPSLRLSVWLWRWDKPRKRFRDWLADLEDAVHAVRWALRLTWPPLRWHALAALRHVLGTARHHDREMFAHLSNEGMVELLVSLLEPPTSPSATRPRGCYPYDLVDQDEVAIEAAMALERLHAGGAEVAAWRTRVEAVVVDLPKKARRALSSWLGSTEMVAEERASSSGSLVSDEIDQLTDLVRLRVLASHSTQLVAAQASLRLLELGEGGAHKLVDALGDEESVHVESLADALSMAALIHVEAGLRSLVAEGSHSRARFYAASILTELGVEGFADAMVEALAAPSAPWARAADVARMKAAGVTLADAAARLAVAPHYAVYQVAVRWLMGHTMGSEQLDALAAFLRVDHDRLARLRVEASLFLGPYGDPSGLPVIASEVMAAGTRSTWIPRSWLATGDAASVARLTRSAMLAGEEAASWNQLIEGLKAPGVSIELREAAVAVLLSEATRPAIQRSALELVDPSRGRVRNIHRLAQIVVWGREQSRRLLSRTLGVRMIGSEELGYTRLESSAIYVNPLPMLRGERNGEAILRGLIVHELGHHKYNADADGLDVWKKAGKLKLQRLHNLVCDEHLERNLRAVDSEWGDDLKRLGAWAFQHAARPMPVRDLLGRLGPYTARVLVGAPLGGARQPTEVDVSLGHLLRALEAAGSSFGRFFRALRMGLGNRWDDPLVGEGLKLFGKSFRKLDNNGLWQVTLELSRIFGDDTSILDIADLHQTARGDEGELIDKGKGASDREVQDKADELEREGKEETDGKPSNALNLGSETNFERIERIVKLDYDPAAHAALAREVGRPARRLREVLEQLGLAWRTERPRVRGFRLDRSRLLALAVRGDPRVLVSRRKVQKADLFMGVVVDCSGSMGGDRMQRARHFAAMLAEACRGLKGVDLRLFGFTESVIYDAGDATRPAAHALEAGGGNNDAAALWHAASVARHSKRSARLLVMISDGLPTQCTADALRGLVRELSSRRNIASAQIAVAKIDTPCFDHYVEVMHEDDNDAVRRFGQIVARLVARTLSGAS